MWSSFSLLFIWAFVNRVVLVFIYTFSLSWRYLGWCHVDEIPFRTLMNNRKCSPQTNIALSPENRRAKNPTCRYAVAATQVSPSLTQLQSVGLFEKTTCVPCSLLTKWHLLAVNLLFQSHSWYVCKILLSFNGLRVHWEFGVKQSQQADA